MYNKLYQVLLAHVKGIFETLKAYHRGAHVRTPVTLRAGALVHKRSRTVPKRGLPECTRRGRPMAQRS